MKELHELKILLMQIREDQDTLREELHEFSRFGNLAIEQITPLNVFENTKFTPHIIDGYDALFIGGSSDASVLKPEKYPFIADSLRLIRHCYEHNIPVLASCFGFQLAVVELGGEVIEDGPNMEMGIYPIHLTDEGKQDPLFSKTPQTFQAISGHKERASRLPEGATLLAYSEKCPYHAFTFHNKPFYAFQFHPEVDRHDLISRITRYEERYFDDPSGLDKMIDNAQEDTPHSNKIIRDFTHHILNHCQNQYKALADSPLC